MELEYLEDIKDDVNDMISNDMKFGSEIRACIARVIHENDLYMSDERPVEKACHYIAIATYAIETNNIKSLDSKVLNEIKISFEIIKSGKYSKFFTEEDKFYISKDIKTIEESKLFK